MTNTPTKKQPANMHLFPTLSHHGGPPQLPVEVASAATRGSWSPPAGPATTPARPSAPGSSPSPPPPPYTWPLLTLRSRLPTSWACVWTMWKSSRGRTCHPKVCSRQLALKMGETLIILSFYPFIYFSSLPWHSWMFFSFFVLF